MLTGPRAAGPLRQQLFDEGQYLRSPIEAVLRYDRPASVQASDFHHEFFVLTGDANLDRRVNLADVNILAANFGLGAAGPHVTPQDWAALAAAVPEPSSSLSVLLPMLMLRRQSRSARCD